MKNIRILLYFGHLLELHVEIYYNVFVSRKGELGPFFSQKSFACVKIIFFCNNMQKVTKEKKQKTLIVTSIP
jgi:hypothetical protein